MSDAHRRALVVRGGWDGHFPVEATQRFIPFLRWQDFTVDVSESLAAYDDAEKLAAYDLVAQCWTQGEISDERLQNLIAAVAGGTGLAGWHGGIVDAFRASPDYLQLTGGQFTSHPGGFVDHDVEILPERKAHPIVDGLEPRWSQHTEQYWSLDDGMNDVLAVTHFRATESTPWRRDVTVPAVWTRRWGRGRIFVSTIGHTPADLDVPPVRTLTERGLLWASRGSTLPEQ
jgi:type 1 glutamine amidotransferase